MKALDLNAYDRRVYEAIVKLIHGRDHTLDEEEIKQEALDLMEHHVHAVSWLASRNSDESDWDRDELERLHKHASGLIAVLNKLSPESRIELHYFFGGKLQPNLVRLHRDVKCLSETLHTGLNKRPPQAKGRPKDMPLAILVEEVVTVFQKASGIDLANLSDPRSQSSRNKINKLNEFAKVIIPKYFSPDSLKKAIKRYIDNTNNQTRLFGKRQNLPIFLCYVF